jgi:hypothetical protein
MGDHFCGPALIASGGLLPVLTDVKSSIRFIISRICPGRTAEMVCRIRLHLKNCGDALMSPVWVAAQQSLLLWCDRDLYGRSYMIRDG